MKTALLVTAALLLTALPVAAAAPTAPAAPAASAAGCNTVVETVFCLVEETVGTGCAGEPPVTGPTHCFVRRAPDPLLLCDAVGLVDVALCIAYGTLGHTVTYAYEVCADIPPCSVPASAASTGPVST